MKNVKNTIIILVAFFASLNTFAADYFLVAGSGWNKIAIINKETLEPIWTYGLPKGGECNSVDYTKAGNIAFSYSKGAAVVAQSGAIIFNIDAGEGEQIQHISEIKGGYLVGICGTPSRILEVDKFGRTKKEITYDTGLKHAHNQHRQIKKTKKGHYLVPIVGKGIILELDSEGNIVREVTVGGVPYSISELPNGNWLVPCGDKGYMVEINPETSEVVMRIDNSTFNDEIKLGFVAETIRYKNGNTIFCNWLGHTKDKQQPILIELNKDNQIIWRVENNTPNLGAISAIDPLNGKFYK
ncbi:MAG: hypothetical protein R3Y26_06540 [Rikenellaceae bacterium]